MIQTVPLGKYRVIKIKPLLQYQSYGIQGDTDPTVGEIQGDKNQTLASISVIRDTG
jgi:hypothetical protein